jgi:hypothetical protein
MFHPEVARLDLKELMWGLQWLPHSSGELEIWLLFSRRDLALLLEPWVSVKLIYLTKQLDETYRIVRLCNSCLDMNDNLH